MSSDDLDDEKPKSKLQRETEAMQREVQKASTNIFNRDITPQEFYYLLSRYPYLQLCDADYPYIDKGTKVEIITAKTGWKIYNYGTMLAAGSHELMAMLMADKYEEEEGGGGSGTIVRQYSETAFEMMILAQKLGWRLASVVSGYYAMQRMAWIAGELFSYPLKGFDPTPEDYVVYRWTSQLYKGLLYPPEQDIPGLKPLQKK